MLVALGAYDAPKLIGRRHSGILWQREDVKIGLNEADRREIQRESRYRP
jgi:hypothetical protein